MPIFLDMFHLGNREPTRPRAPIEAALRQRPLNTVKVLRRRNQCCQEYRQFEDAVRNRCFGMQYLIDLPFGLYGFPRPPTVELESKLVRTGLCIFGDRTEYLWVEAELLKLLRETACEHRK